MGLLLLLILLFPTLAYSDELELGEIEIIGEEIFSPPSLPEQQIQLQVKERNTLQIGHYSPSDIIVQFHNITLNDSSDNKVDLGHYPSFLLHNLNQSDALSFGPSFTIQEKELTGTILSNIHTSSLQDFELFNQFQTQYLSGFIFGSYSLGRFVFDNAKGESQIRDNNESRKLGGAVYSTYQVKDLTIQPFLFYSNFNRGIGGLSEYPQFYKDGVEKGDLALFNTTFTNQFEYSTLSAFLSYRFQSYSYDNPHARIKRDSKFTGIDNSLELESKYEHQLGDWFVGGEIKDKIDHYNDKTRNQFLLSASALWSYQNLKIQAQTPLLFSTTIHPQYTLSIDYNTDSYSLHFSTARLERLPTFNELYFRNEFIHGDSELKPQVEYPVKLASYYKNRAILLGATITYTYSQNLIRFIQETPTLFAAKNIPDTHILQVSPSIKVEYNHFLLSALYTFTWSKVKTGYRLPMVSEHELELSVGFTTDTLRLIAFYSWSSPKYLNFANTTESLIDSNLSLQFIYKLKSLQIELELDNILNQRRETSIQFPLPKFNASLNLTIAL